MPTERAERFQLGEFWIDRRDGSPYWYVFWVVKQGARYRTCRLTTRERDFGRAQKFLAEHVVQNTKLEDERPQDVSISVVLDRYYDKYGKNLASRDTVAAGIAKWKEFWKDATVADLRSEVRQSEFIAWFESRPAPNGHGETLSAGTIRRQLNVGRSALTRAYQRHEIAAVPFVDTYKPSERMAADRDVRILTVKEMTALLNAAADSEHLWRYLLLRIGSASRPGAPLQIQPSMVDCDNQRLNLLPPGVRQQPKKRRPIIPICATLLPWLRVWTTKENLTYRSLRGQVAILDRLITWRGKRIKTVRRGFDMLKERAGIVDEAVVPYSIRHTVATWLVMQKVPEYDREVFLGHKAPGSATTARYVHLDPEYLRPVATAIDGYFDELIAAGLQRPLRASCAPVLVRK